ncbi:MAG: site-2 protease family protein, partial [Ruminococcus sp.]|nr:site-2 protease family protein [Ruminococcus sp.]
MALIIIGILMFELIIFFHEFGHFITAKLSGVKVNEFALGMGPKLFGFKKGETQYSLRLFPIGGYCAMEGEDADSPEPRAFNNAKIWKRMIIIIAGATMNILLGFIMMFAYTVQMDVYSSTTVSGFEPNSFSLNCGLKPGDKILDVNGYSILNARDLQFAIATLTPKQLDGHSLEIYRQDCSREACMVYQNLAQKYSPDQDTNQEMLSALTSASYKIAEAESKEAAYSLMKQAIDDLYSKIADAKNEKYEYPEITESDERWRFCADMTVERGDEKQKLEQVQFYTYYKSQEDKENNKMSVAFDFYVEPVEKTFGSVMHET